MKQDPFVIERTCNAPVEKVWKALTDKDQMKKWYFDLPAFKAEKGFEFEFAKQDRLKILSDERLKFVIFDNAGSRRYFPCRTIRSCSRSCRSAARQ